MKNKHQITNEAAEEIVACLIPVHYDKQDKIDIAYDIIQAAIEEATKASEIEKLNPHTGTCDSSGHGQPL